jgi:hypothetical protein
LLSEIFFMMTYSVHRLPTQGATTHSQTELPVLGDAAHTPTRPNGRHRKRAGSEAS